MIESALLFLLGFLAAILLGLLVAPAYRRRIVALTRRRIEATVPLTREEILAEKDRLRAEHAMEIRRVEIAARTLREANAVQLVELGQARVLLAQTSDERVAQGHALAESETRCAALTAELAKVKAQAAELDGSLTAAETAMKARGAEMEAFGRELDEALLVSSNRQIDLVARETEIDRLKGEIAALKAEAVRGLDTGGAAVAAARAAHAEELAALGRQSEEASLTASGRQIELVARETEIDRLKGELAELKSETERRLKAADEAVASLRAERAALDDAGAPAGAAHAADEERGRLHERLTLLMRENRRLKDELADFDAAPKAQDATAGDEALRERLAAMAAEIVVLTAAVEGPDSPIPAMIAGAPEGAAGRPSLADRIRALQRKAIASEPRQPVQGDG